MGTNVYLRRKEPRMVPEYDEVHVAKLSGGWRARFDGSSATPEPWDGDEYKPRVGSMDALRDYLSTGEWVLMDEYGGEITLEEMLAHVEDYTRVSLDDYYDREGYLWSRKEFR